MAWLINQKSEKLCNGLIAKAANAASSGWRLAKRLGYTLNGKWLNGILAYGGWQYRLNSESG